VVIDGIKYARSRGHETNCVAASDKTADEAGCVCGERKFGQGPIGKQETYAEVLLGNFVSHIKE
jgi:hypothetical protein